VKIPGPDHPISIVENPKRITVSFGGHKIADTRNAILLHEANYPGVNYIPRADVDMSALERTEHSTTCPFKGDAAYYSIRLGDQAVDNVVWTYETPHPAVKQIESYLAFYPQHVTLSEEP